MNETPFLDFDHDVNLPVSGKTPRSRHASRTGAVKASKDRGQLSVAMLRLLREAGHAGLSDYEMARALARPLSSMNSTRNGLGNLVIPSGSFETTEFGTRRTRWTVNPDRISGALKC